MHALHVLCAGCAMLHMLHAASWLRYITIEYQRGDYCFNFQESRFKDKARVHFFSLCAYCLLAPTIRADTRLMLVVGWWWCFDFSLSLPKASSIIVLEVLSTISIVQLIPKDVISMWFSSYRLILLSWSLSSPFILLWSPHIPVSTPHLSSPYSSRKPTILRV